MLKVGISSAGRASRFLRTRANNNPAIAEKRIASSKLFIAKEKNIPTKFTANIPKIRVEKLFL